MFNIKLLIHYLKIFTNWRYWPKEVLYFPLAIRVFIFGAMRARSMFYFSAANPNVSLGGFAGDSKIKIMEKVPYHLKPITLFVCSSEKYSDVVIKLGKNDLVFPLIAKPDIGEGGFLVTKIDCSETLRDFHENYTMNYLLQEFINEPLEFSVLVHDANGVFEISSVTQRKYLTFKGDGKSNIDSLIKQNPNSIFRQKKVRGILNKDLGRILAKDEIWEPIQIGNWDYGATYLNYSKFINDKMVESFQSINNEVGLFHYARYDVKCSSIDSLSLGNLKIIEINGVKGEPIHIYDLSTDILYAYKEIFKHWNYIMKIALRNIKMGNKPVSIFEGIRILYRHYITKNKSLKPREIYE